MYVVTFYSFKGGVGRTLSLANVGLELARTGRRVLLVDFDLEAPGLHTFNLLKPKQPHFGLVDYITDYTDSLSSPDGRNYIYEALGVGQQDGRLWVMPAGKDDKEYSGKLAAINWQQLYKKQDGFLMFEDMKAQWKASYEFDYVLIDSRTGHTDIGGICTRQLPDAVVTLFFPNEQNLNGLKPIISDIRAEDEKSKRKTHLHFVMSNVPDLDDEDEILANLELKFQDELGYEKLASTIYRYDSLSLLQQSLFVAERPNSRLAKEYKRLMQEITEENIEDREGVIQSLTKKSDSIVFRKHIRDDDEENRVDKIARHHAKDGELLYLLAMRLKRLGRSKKSELLLAKSIECGYHSPEALLIRAENLQKDGEDEEALNILWKLFEYTDLDREQLGSSVDIVRRINPEKLLGITKTPAFKTLTVRKTIWLSSELNWCKQGLEAFVELLSRYYRDSELTVSTAETIKESQMLSLIGLGRFIDAVRVFGKSRPNPEDLSMADCFNYAMAEWGLKKEIPQDIFSHVVELDLGGKNFKAANYSQCLAISYWATGNTQEALKRLEQAVDMISDELDAEFSCWRYLTVTPEDFRNDCSSIKQLIEGKEIVPLFWRG